MTDAPLLRLTITLDEFGVPEIEASYEDTDAWRIAILLRMISDSVGYSALGNTTRQVEMIRPNKWPFNTGQL